MPEFKEPMRIAVSNNAPNTVPITRAVTAREGRLIDQINLLKEQLLLAEIALDEKEVNISKVKEKSKTQQRQIDKFDQYLEGIKKKSDTATDKFKQLKVVASKASDIARTKSTQLKLIELEISKYQQQIEVSNQLQLKLVDLLAKKRAQVKAAKKQDFVIKHKYRKKNKFFDSSFIKKEWLKISNYMKLVLKVFLHTYQTLSNANSKSV